MDSLSSFLNELEVHPSLHVNPFFKAPDKDVCSFSSY